MRRVLERRELEFETGQTPQPPVFGVRFAVELADDESIVAITAVHCQHVVTYSAWVRLA